MDRELQTKVVQESIFLLHVPDGVDPDTIVTWRPTMSAAEDFQRIYNMNRYQDQVEITEVPYV